jgi:hypothetical protein
MVSQRVKVRGVLNLDGTLQLDTSPNLPPGPVEIELTTAGEDSPPEGEELMTTLARIWKQGEEEGRVPQSAAEIDAEIDALRDEFEERLAQLDRLDELPKSTE